MQLRQTLIRFLQAGGGAVRWRALAAVCALAALAVPVRAQSNAFSFSSGVYVVAENTPGFATITVLYGGGATNAVSVDYATGGGTATNNVHYTGLTNTLVFAVGDTSNIFTIPIFDDAVSNGARTVGLTLANPQGGAILGAPVAATLLITDDESPTNLPPANNQFTNAAILTGLFGTFANTNTFANKETGEPNHAGNAGGASVWFRWSAPASGPVTFSTVGSGFNTLLAAYTGVAVSGLTPIASDDDSGGGGTSTLTFTAVAGQVYYIAVDGSGGAQGSYILSWGNAGSAGTFGFTTGNFLMSERDGGAPTSLTVSQTYTGGRITITRYSGMAGKVRVFYRVSDGTARRAPGDWTLTGGGVESATSMTNSAVFFDGQTAASFFIVPTLRTNNDNIPTTVNLAITGIQFEPGESSAVIPGSIDPVAGTSVARILDGQQGVSLQRLRWRTIETIGTAVVRVLRGNLPFSDGLGTIVTVDMLNNGTPNAPGPASSATLDASSDHAQSNLDFTPSVTTITWVAGQTSADISIPILDDALVEFDEDLAITLRPEPGNGAPQSDTTDGTLTIEFPNNTAANVVTNKHPAGSVDPGWNRDYFLGSNPPDNSAPGANGRVFAVAVQSDLKTVIGGEFTSVNTSPRNRIARMNSDGSLDANFNVGTGANGAVNGLAVSTNGQVIIGGAFSSYSGTLRGGVARLSTNAVLDPSFNPGAGATGGPVRAVALYTNGVNEGKVIVVGDFTSFAGVNARRLVRLNADGSVDPLFSAGLGPNGTGPNGAVNAVLLQSNGKLVIGGDFTSINSVSRNRVARLNADGTLDATFNPGAGADNSVFALGLDRSGVSLTVDRTASGGPEEDRFTIDTGATSGTITINYEFYLIPDSIHVYYGGALIFDTGVTNGAGTINVPYGPGASTTVDIVVNEGGSPDPGTQWDYSATITPNGGVQRYLVGGAFTTMDFQSRNRLARLNPDGSLDTTYDPGFGADDTIYSIAPATNGPAYIGGLFASYNGTRRIGLARVATDGTLDTGFMDAAYNQFAGIPTGFSPFGQPKNSVRALAVHRDGGVMIGGSFHQVGGGGRNQVASGPNSPWGPNVSTPVEITRDDLRNRYNIARIIGGTTAGPGNIGFTTSDYTADENGGARFITVARSNGSLGGAGALFATGDRPAGPGAASSTTDYVPFAGTLNWPRDVVIPASSAYTGVNNTTGTGQDDVSVTILPDNLVEGEERLNLTLDLPQSTFFSLGGQFIPTGVALGRSRATLTIEDDTPEPTYVTFATNSFIVDEGAGVATISVLRSGNTGNSVTLNFLTLDGSALNNSDYTSVFGPLTFSSGETNRTFNVPITDDTFAELDETIILQLTNLVGAVFLPGGNAAILTIHDNDFANGQLRFSQTNFNAVENSGLAQVVVQRTGGNVGAITAQVVTSNLTALAGADYTGVTNTLSWANGDTSQRVINIPLLPDGLVEGPEFFTANIINAQVVANGNPVSVAVPTATVTILDSDAYGSLHFAAANFTVSENGGKAIITVTRTGGSSGTVSVNYNTADGTAFGGVNYTPVIGTLTLGPGVTSTNFTVPVTDDFVQNANRTVFLNLNTFVNATPAAPTAAILTIVDDESVNEPAGSVDTTYNAAAGANDFIYSLALQPDGQLVIGGDFTVFNNFGRRRLARLDANGNLDPVFLPPGGANDSVRSITVQPDGRLIVGGFFTNVAATTRNHLSRLNTDGTTDSSFDPGAGADGPVFATALHGDPANAGRIIVGGNFAAFNGNPHPFLARLLTNGVVDESFNPGVGPDGTVYAAAVQPDGKVLIAGDFRNVAGQPAQGLARLNPNGALDAAFVGNLGTGFTGSVRALALQSDGRILVGGLFTNFNGAVVGRLVRLQANGTVDAGFAPNNSFAAGGDGSVLGLALQPDGKLIVVGDFSKFSSVTRNRITRLKEDGTVDPTINFGLGANNFVAAGVVQITDGRIIVAGGFTAFDGLARNHLARLYGGVLDGPGRMEFSSATYVVAEAGTNATITVRRTGGTTGDVTVTAFTSDGTATAGLDYGAYSNTLAFVTGEVVQTFVVGITNDSLVEGDEFLNLTLATNALSGVTLGNQPVATLTIIDDDSFVAFSAAAYSVNEGVNSGVVPITVVRTGGTNGTFTVQVVTSNLTATAGADYIGLTNTLTFLPGELSKTVNITIKEDALVEGDETFAVRLVNAVGSVSLGNPTVATVTIVDNDFFPGQFMFASATGFVVDENATNALITVIRTNGSSGNVTVNFATSDGTASAGLDYLPTNGVLFFGEGETSKTFTVRIISDLLIETNETVFLTLSGPTGNATIAGPNPTTLTIINNNEFIFGNLRFSTNAYTATEGGPAALVTVVRTGGSSNTITVDFATSNGTATAGQDYTGTNGTLTFLQGETNKTFTVPILTDNLVESNETVNLTLFNATGGSSVAPPSTATLTIVSTNALPGSFAFSQAAYSVVENAGVATITVFRTNGFTSNVTVNVRVTAGTATPLADYNLTNNAVFTLAWTNGDTAPKTFDIPILDDLVVEPPETIFLTLENPTGGAVVSTTNASLTIIDNEIPAGSVDTTFESGANGTVYSVFLNRTDGRVAAGGDFTVLTAGGLGRTNVGRFGPGGLVDAFDPGSILLNGTTNTTVRAVAIYTNGPHAGQIVAAGLFTTVAGQTHTNLVRFNSDASLDNSFNVGLGPNAIVHAVRLLDDGSMFVGGAFTAVGGTPAGFVAKLAADGSVDGSFNPPTGPNDVVRALALQADGKVVIGGDFTVVNNVTNNHVARFNADGGLDTAFTSNALAGADAPVYALALQSDGRILVGGAFTNLGGAVLNRLGRLNANGSVDAAQFNQLGAGFNNSVFAVALQPDGKILAGGSFTSFTNQFYGRLIRLLTNGAADVSINFGAGANDFVDALVVQDDGKIVIGGGFTQFNQTPALRIARLNGGDNIGAGVIEFLSPVFSVNEAGTNAVITVVRYGGLSNTVTATFDTTPGTATAGADYTPTNGTLTFLPGDSLRTFLVPIVNDSLVESDETVNLRVTGVGGGAQLGAVSNATLTIIENDGVISFLSPFYAVGEQSGTALITVVRTGGSASTVTVDFATGGGNATVVADYTATNGTLTFNPGEVSKTFPITIIDDALIEPNETVGLILSNITGPATIGLSNATLTIVDDDSGPGSVGFSAANYTVFEGQPVATITLLRTNGSSGAISVLFSSGDGTAINGQDYTAASVNVAFGAGEVIKTIDVPILNDSIVEPNETVLLSLSGPRAGSPSNAVLTIVDDDSQVLFVTNTFTVIEDTPGLVTLTVVRQGATNTAVSVDFSTASGTAVDGSDFVGNSGTLLFPPGVTSQVFTVTIVPDTLVEGNEFFNVLLSNPTNTMFGSNASAQVIIIDDDSVIGFSAPTYSVNEAGTNAVITVTRTGNLNGTATATVVISGLTATDGVDFTGGTNVLNFAVNQTNQTFNVPIINDNVVEGDETVNLRLVSATGSSSLGLQTNAVLTIVDDDFYGRISFSSAAYSVSEAGVFATITVIRTNGTAGIVSVNFATGNGSALAGADYTATNGVLVFPDGVTIAQFAVLITNDFLVEGNETVNLTLGNVAGGASLGDQPAAVLTIVDDDFYGAFQFSTNAFVANESAGAATITVLRVGGSAGTVSVNYATAPGTATVGSDFTLTNGVLVFTNGVTSQSFNVPLFNDNVGEPDETVLLSLSGPAGGATLGGPVAATLTIVDDDSSPALSSGSYTVNEAAGVAVITVLRLGTTNNALSVDYYLTNGTATAGLDYTNVTGTINWAPGDNSPKTFNIPIINDVAIEGNETVKIILTNPQGGSGTLAEPSQATLAIVDDDVSAFFVGAGAVLVIESGPTNGVIDPGEIVTLTLALRNVGSNTTASLVATLLTTNGVVLPSGAQNYGSVIAGGPSVAKSFSFTATGTNGGVLIAVLQLQDGATNYGAVPFAFTLGTVTSKFANTNTITINDASPATPYPAVINVSDVPGVISRVTVTLSNLTHSFPGDLDMVLVGPNGQKVMIMSDAGSSANTPNPVNNVTVTFDDAAPAGMTTNQITNGVYKPTNLTIGGADFFPPPGPGAATNFSSVLSAFNGTSPNGAWSLFIIDDNNLDSGVILNGWCLTFTQAAPVNPAGDLAVTMSGPPVATAGQPIIYTLTVTNAGANTADNVVLTNLLPGALTYAPLSNPHGTFFQAGNTAIFQLGSIGVGLSKTLTITANSAGAATVTNVATATSTLTDTNLANNTASVTTVVSQSADLAITLTDSPDAVVINTLLTYSITVVNNGPSTATGVVVTNVLPPTVNFVSGTNAFGLIATNGNIVTATLGSLANGAVANITLVVRPTVTNLITDSASVSSAVSDLNPANNAVSAKTFVIGPPSLVQQQSGGSFVFSWPLVANNFVLECTTNLAPPIVWSAVTNAPVDADPLRVVTIPIDPAAAVKVFRLRQVP